MNQRLKEEAFSGSLCHKLFVLAAASVHPVHRGAGAVCEQEGRHRHQPRGPDRGAGPQRQLPAVPAAALPRGRQRGQSCLILLLLLWVGSL